jgi:phosphatidate cytidylyltransferase
MLAASFPAYHELVMPFSASFLMIWLLIFNKKSASISEISTSLLGMFYIGYLPSFWVRLRALDHILTNPTLFPTLLGRFKWMNVNSWTDGSVITWWTWTSIVFADVGAYFIGV